MLCPAAPCYNTDDGPERTPAERSENITEEKIRRISELAKKSRTPEGLTEEEKAEQAGLRAEYVAAMKQSLRSQLDSTVIVRPDGTRQPLKKNGR